MAPSPTRDRLTEGIFTPQDENEPLGRIEAALVKVIAAETVEKKLRMAQRQGVLQRATDEDLLTAGIEAGVITTNEAQTVEQANAFRAEVIRVDDFPADSWEKGAAHA